MADDHEDGPVRVHLLGRAEEAHAVVGDEVRQVILRRGGQEDTRGAARAPAVRQPRCRASWAQRRAEPAVPALADTTACGADGPRGSKRNARVSNDATRGRESGERVREAGRKSRPVIHSR